MNRKGFAPLIIIGIVAVFIIAGVVGYFVWKKSVATQPQTSTAVVATNPTTPASPTSTVDVSGWKTYTNQQYGLSFKYPSDWSADSSDGGVFVDSSSTLRASAGQPEGGADVVMSFDQNPNNLSAQSYYGPQNQQSLFDDPITSSTQTIDGILAYDVTPSITEGGGESDIIIPRQNFFIHLMVFTNSPTFQDILSTFQISSPT